LTEKANINKLKPQIHVSRSDCRMLAHLSRIPQIPKPPTVYSGTFPRISGTGVIRRARVMTIILRGWAGFPGPRKFYC